MITWPSPAVVLLLTELVVVRFVLLSECIEFTAVGL